MALSDEDRAVVSLASGCNTPECNPEPHRNAFCTAKYWVTGEDFRALFRAHIHMVKLKKLIQKLRSERQRLPRHSIVALGVSNCGPSGRSL